MSGHVFHEIYLHINWHTKGDRPMLSAALEPEVHQWILDRIRQTKGVYFHAVGGTATHVHVAVNTEPFVTISDLVGDWKGACSREINQQHRQKVLQWQRGFGVVSFGKRQLGWVKAYIANQKDHHACGNTQERLERTTSDEDGSPYDHA